MHSTTRFLPLLALACGCATTGTNQGQPLVPAQVQARTGPFDVYAANPLEPDAPAVRALRSLERDVAAGLDLRAPAEGPAVEVYVLQNRDAFTHFLTYYYPELPPRRAFFLAQGSKRIVYTYTNDRLDEDLRHEATHALLHASVGDLPLWLDEGLAEYFEGPETTHGVNAEHLGRLPDDLGKGWKPDLARLEALKSVKDMTPRDYRESWAWVHYFLDPADPAGKRTLLSFLAETRSGHDAPEPLSARLARNGEPPEKRMLAHLDHLRAKRDTLSLASAKPPKVLLQSAAPEPAAAKPAGRRSLFGRFLGLFGVGDR